MKNVFLISVFILCLQGCSSTEEAIVVRNYDPYNVTEKMDLKFSDLAEDVRIVPLETHPDALIPDCKYAVNDKYIVALNNKAIVQFDALTGKYIRVLATNGKGPNEFSQLYSAYIRDNKLMYTEYGKEYVSVIDLQTGRFLPNLEMEKGDRSLPVWIDPAAEDFYYMHDTCLIKIYNPALKTSRFVMDTVIAGERMAARTEDVNMRMQRSYGSKSLATYQGDQYIYNAAFADTLYLQRKDSGELIPYSAFIRPETQIGANTALGIPSSNSYDLTIPYVGREYILGMMTEGVLKVTDQSINVMKLDRGVCCIDRKNGSIKKVGKYIFDPLFVKEFKDLPEELISSDNSISRHILGAVNSCADNGLFMSICPAYQVKEYIEAYLESARSELSDKVKKELESLNGKLTEESNPVAFIGKQR